MFLTLLLDMHLFHHLTELAVPRLAHAFLLVPSDLERLLPPSCLLHRPLAGGSPCLWLFQSKKCLLHLLQIAPFFSLMPYISPEGIKLYTAELFLSHYTLKLLYMSTSFL